MDITAYQHAAIAFVLQVIVGLITGNWLAGGCLAVGIFIGREHAQAEYRYIELYAGGKRANMPWYGGFLPRVWDQGSILDFALPVAVTVLVFIISLFF